LLNRSAKHAAGRNDALHCVKKPPSMLSGVAEVVQRKIAQHQVLWHTQVRQLRCLAVMQAHGRQGKLLRTAT
jgi:hypothetical protein